MTRRITSSATHLLFVPWDGRTIRDTPPVQGEMPPERKSRRSGWFTAMRRRTPLS
ncbi:hypothetical protein QKW60_08575 [Defluviimonas aestuarii]|uniref:hypothetical protein n=1 Tax=Albidovulum aestuarii TaxID=1130726 RepID=UPI00249CCBD5|nr:hypothetical protein [Defluviimonas aestuarii]MDI3336457.1 hypothetical protein [Defluviimonas aestuarii]